VLDMRDRNHTIVLSERPVGKLQVGHFRHVDAPMPDGPGPGEVLCRNILLSISPGSRSWMQQAPSYRARVAAGDPMSAYTLAEVVTANGASHVPGDIVICQGAWQEWSVLPEAAVQTVRVRGLLTHHLSVFGANGLTAYFGMLDVGRPAPGQTVVVSAAAGSVGSLAGQLACLEGARVVGITSSAEKNRMVREKLGFAATAGHRSDDFPEELTRACPDGIDVYFDNVGGRVLEAVLERMNDHGTVVCCGAVSQYDGPAPGGGTRGVPMTVITKRLRLQGIQVFDYAGQFEPALDHLEALVLSGGVIALEDVRDGIESAPAALVDLLAGRNVGKVMVRVGRDPDPCRRRAGA
jgi:NADPH-dependent curcumin reductase CurA